METSMEDQGDSPRELDRSTDSASEPRKRGSLVDPESRRIYLETLAETGNLAAAARAAGFTRRAATYRRESEPEFDRLVTEALEKYQSHVHAEIRRRGIEGVEQPVFHQGQICGHVVKYSDRLLEMEARRVMPEYREAMAGSGGSKITNNIAVTATAQAANAAANPQNPMTLDVSRMTKTQRDAYRAFLATMEAPQELTESPPRAVLDVPGETPQAIQSPPGEDSGDE